MGLHLWYTLGDSPEHGYRSSNIALLRVSQAGLYLSLALLLSGTVLGALKHGIHVRLMVGGLMSFYFGVMYAQVPGFTRLMPNKWLSYATLASLLVGVPTSFWAPFAAAMSLTYGRGIGTSLLKLPNLLPMVGLWISALSTTPMWVVYGFPLASALSLMLRVDPARGGYRPNRGLWALTTAVYTLVPLMGPTWIPATGLAVLAATRGIRLKGAYNVGATLAKAGLLLTPLGTHAVYMSIAIVMATICVPLLVPGIMLREVPKGMGPMPAIMFGGLLARVLWALEIAAAIVVASTAYMVYRLLKGKRIAI